MDAFVTRRPTLRHRLQDPTQPAAHDILEPPDPTQCSAQFPNHIGGQQLGGGSEAGLRNTQRRRLSQLQLVGRESLLFEEITTQQAEYVFEEDVWDRAAFGLQRWLDDRKQKPGTLRRGPFPSRHERPDHRQARRFHERSFEERVRDVGCRGLNALDRVERFAAMRSQPDVAPKLSRIPVSSPELRAAPSHSHLRRSLATPAGAGRREMAPWPTSLRYVGCGARAQAAGAPAPLAARWHAPIPGAVGPRWR